MLQMQSRGRAFDGAGDKRVFDRQEYSCSIGSFEVPQKLTRRGGGNSRGRLLMSDHSRDAIDHHSKLSILGAIEPHENDVLMGRGGKNNRHSGNDRLRQMARLYREEYQVATKKGKSHLSRQLVQQMRELSPATRFLKRDANTKAWEDVGDDAAREKASQVLRDAVGTIPEPMDREYDQELRRTASEPAPERHESVDTAYARAPIQAAVSESFPAASPATSSRKRQRYSDPGYAQQYPVDTYESRHGRHHYESSHQEYRPTRQRTDQHPGRYVYSDPRPPPVPQVVSSASPSSGYAAGERGRIYTDEFELFNCELLESDHEDHAEPLPPEPHDDVF